nr:WD repeat-containing protein 63 [Meriones unguiculatus]
MAPKTKKSPQKKRKRKAKQITLDTEEEEAMNMESMGHPEIYPLVITTKTQEIFNCRVEDDITDEQQYKLIKKEDILADLLNRAAVSDFHPVKKIVREYPGEELLLVYDKDFKYGHNFYLIGTEEGKENYFKALEVPEEQEELKDHAQEEVYIYKPPVSKPWISFGSEKEIEEESVKESKKRVMYMISRKRSEFGSPVFFHDQNASRIKDAYIECPSYEDKNYVLTQIEKDVGLQVIPDIKGTSTQTKWAFPKNATTQYYAREFPELEREALLQSKSLADFLGNVSTRNTNFIFFGLKYDNIPPIIVIPWLMLESPDDIFCFEFCPSDPNIIAGGCINGQIVLWDITAHVDNIENIKSGGSRTKKPTLKPMFLLEPDSNKEAMYIRHCAVSSIENGHRKVITDIHWLPDSFEINRMGSVFENRNGISCQLVTCSADCTVCFWDIRPQKPASTAAAAPTSTGPGTATADTSNTQQAVPEKKKEETIEVPFDVPSTFMHLDLSWKPLSRIKLSKGETNLDHCPTKLSLGEDPLLCRVQGTSSMHILLKEKMLNQIRTLKAAEIYPYQNLEAGMANTLKPIDDFCTKFFVGTEEGEVIYTDWKMERDSETGRFMAKKPVNLYTVHDGAVHTIQRSPFYNDIILTVGGWNVAIWKEEVMTGPLLQTCCAPKRYTAGHWSLTRPGVFYIGREDGYVDIWDLLEKTHEPTQSQNICITMITYIKPWTFSSKQQFIAIADYYGTLHILEIPWTLSHPSFNEVSSVNYYFEREVKHLEYVQQRKTIREQEKTDMALELARKKAKVYQKTREVMEAELRLEFENYLDLEKSILFSLGLSKDTEKVSTWI